MGCTTMVVNQREGHEIPVVGFFPMKYPVVVYVSVYCILQRLARLAMYSNRGRKGFPNSLIQ